MSQSSQVKSKERVAAHGEVFTAEREVKAICDLVAFVNTVAYLVDNGCKWRKI